MFLDLMEKQVDEFKSKDQSLDVKKDKMLIEMFRNLYRDFLYLHDENKRLNIENKRFFERGTTLAIANKRIIEVCENLKNQLKAKDF